MGSTFGALYVKGVHLDRAVAWVEASFAGRGFDRIERTAPEDPGSERRVVVYEVESWVVIADEEQTHTEDPDELGRWASDELPGDVVAITVIHSDTARLRRFRNGARRSGLLVGAPSGRKKLASTKFLVDLAVSPEARAGLDAGLRTDYALPEETVYQAAELIGLPNPSVRSSDLWNEPPSGGVAMRFRWPKAEAEPSSAPNGLEFALADGHALLAQSNDLETCLGAPFREDLHLHLQLLQGGSRIEGLGIELRGPALELLGLRKLHGFGSNGTDRVSFEVALERRGDAWFGAFPTAVLAAEPRIERAAPFGSQASLRQMIAQQAQRTDEFMFSCEGYAAAAGHAELVLLPTTLGGTPLDATDVCIEVDVLAASFAS